MSYSPWSHKELNTTEQITHTHMYIYTLMHIYAYIRIMCICVCVCVCVCVCSFPSGSDSEQSTCHAGDPSFIPGLGRSPGGGHSNPLQCSCVESPHGQRSLANYSPWGHKELDMTEQLSTEHIYVYVCEYMCVCVFIAQILASQKS